MHTKAKYFLFAAWMFILSLGQVESQSIDPNICFNLIFNETPLVLDQEMGGLKLESFKCYISKLEFYKKNEKVYSVNNGHLLNAAQPESLCIVTSLTEQIDFDEIRFNIGIDSLVNVSGAMGGDLDPIKGMYWTWQSGYINFKLEGSSILCPARNNRFQFHIGGYQEPFNALRKVVLKYEQGISSNKAILIDVSIDQLLQRIDLKEVYEVMSPNSKAMIIADLLPGIFTLSNNDLK